MHGQAPNDESPLSPRRAFVVQVREKADVELDYWAGRIEHVTSGQSTHFQSLQEMVAFISGVLASLSRKASDQ